VKEGWSQNGGLYCDYAWVGQVLQYSNFSLHLSLSFCRELAQVILFAGKSLACLEVGALFDHCVSSVTDLLAQRVVTQICLAILENVVSSLENQRLG
jgi:hypothetical protein